MPACVHARPAACTCKHSTGCAPPEPPSCKAGGKLAAPAASNSEAILLNTIAALRLPQEGQRPLPPRPPRRRLLRQQRHHPDRPCRGPCSAPPCSRLVRRWWRQEPPRGRCRCHCQLAHPRHYPPPAAAVPPCRASRAYACCLHCCHRLRHLPPLPCLRCPQLWRRRPPRCLPTLGGGQAPWRGQEGGRVRRGQWQRQRRRRSQLLCLPLAAWPWAPTAPSLSSSRHLPAGARWHQRTRWHWLWRR